jgi:hypothetical protein
MQLGVQSKSIKSLRVIEGLKLKIFMTKDQLAKHT